MTKSKGGRGIREITPQDVYQIRKDFASGIPGLEIAKNYPITTNAIYKVLYCETYKDITTPYDTVCKLKGSIFGKAIEEVGKDTGIFRVLDGDNSNTDISSVLEKVSQELRTTKEELLYQKQRNETMLQVIAGLTCLIQTDSKENDNE